MHLEILFPVPMKEGKAARGEKDQIKGEQHVLEEIKSAYREGRTAAEETNGICPLSVLFRLRRWELGLQ